MRTENFILYSTIVLCVVGIGQNACAQSASDGNSAIKGTVPLMLLRHWLNVTVRSRFCSAATRMMT